MAPDRLEAGHAEEQDERDVGATLRSSPSLDPRDPDPSHHSPSSRSVLVLFRGLPGVGKSTLARAVSLELGNAPLVDKDDARDALAEVFSEREDDDEEEGEEEEEEREQGRKKKRESELFRQRLNEASYAAAFNAARTLLTSSRCPCVLLDSPLSRASAAERALRLAEELNKKEKKEKDGGGDDDAGAPSSSSSPSSLAFVVVAVGNSDEGLWRRRLEARAAALTESGSHSARHKPRRWAEVEALRDRGRRELLLEEEEEEDKNSGGGGEWRGERSDPSPSPSPSPLSAFGERMLRDLGVDRRPSPSSRRRPFSRLWGAASARFVVDTATAAAGEEERGEEGAFMKAAAGRVAAAVRSALVAGGRALDDDGGGVVFLER